MIEIRAAELVRVDLPLVRPFRTSFGEQTVRQAVLLRLALEADGRESEGWGECVAMTEPLYSEEYGAGAWAALRDFLVPALAREPLSGPEEVARRLDWVRGNRMAKAAVEMAVLDAVCRAQGWALREHLGGKKDHVECGVSVGLAPTPEALLEEIAGYVERGYRRVKVKVAPGEDVSVLETVRSKFPDVPLMADANGAFTLGDLPTLREFDQFDLMMVEQPLAEGDLRDHAILARQMRTPVCLDESVRSAKDALDAIEMGSCRIVNVKAGRVGGLLEARRIHDLALSRDVPVWCGGMLETGLGRAANLALASLEGFTLPGDTSASDRYYHEDLTEPFVLAPDGTMAVPTGPGIGVAPLPEVLRRRTAIREAVPL
jgi:O-succinylbenzoate synthase